MDDTRTEIEVHNRNSIRTEEHLSVSVDNDRSNLDALDESQNPKIETSESESTDRICCSGLAGDPRLHHRDEGGGGGGGGDGGERGEAAPFRRTRPVIKNSQKINEQKNEILSRTVGIGKLFKSILYCVIILLLFNVQVGVDSAPARSGESYAIRRSNPARHRKPINKNCKEYDVSSRAFAADLIFEGKARSKREFGQYITFSIQKIIKLRKSGLKPKNQIRLHFGAGRRNQSRSQFLNECLRDVGVQTLRWKLKFGTSYYVFADLSGPMNYTAKGDPIVANRRNLKSIRTVVSADREKPPRVRGLQDQNLKTSNALRLSCRIKGTPVPRINWYKDGAPLIPSKHVNVTYYSIEHVVGDSPFSGKIINHFPRDVSERENASQIVKHKTKNSTVEIKSLELEDRGRYECRATSMTGKTANMSAYVNVSEYQSGTTTNPEWRYRTVKCQVDSYCLNGGTCEFIENLGEHMCKCQSGYVGARCENKQLETRGTSSYECGFTVGYSHFYC